MYRSLQVAWLTIGFLVLIVAGCTHPDWIEQTLVTVDVTGEWRGSWASSVPGVFAGDRPVVLTLTQKGPKVTGQITMGAQSNGPYGPIEGTVSGDIFGFHDLRNRVNAQLQVNGDEMTGRGTDGGFAATVTLRRVP
jgi:hypothetical protein